MTSKLLHKKNIEENSLNKKKAQKSNFNSKEIDANKIERYDDFILFNGIGYKS